MLALNKKNMQKITTCIWLNFNADEALEFYKGIFKDFKLGGISYWGQENPAIAGKILVANFQVLGTKIILLNAGPDFTLSEAMSLVINCKGQEEVDYYWNALTKDGGLESNCGWLKDKFGVSWQIVPSELEDIMRRPDKEGTARAMAKMMQMKKLIIADLEEAYKG
jgi:predicted 3-demethylubiquinone-9 3-methyltransferase (glyoxalase superfamily)